MTTTTFALKNIRSLSSGAWTASLYENGKRVAVVSDDGRGGQPDIWPTGKPKRIREEINRLEAGLTAWAQGNVPDWYLTSFGTYDRLTPTWELALGYLDEVAEYTRLAKGGFLYRAPDGDLYRYADRFNLSERAGAGHVWHNGTWEVRP